MKNKHSIDDILKAVDALLNNNNGKEKLEKLESIKFEKPLKLVDEISNQHDNFKNVPNDTEKIISEAEKYLNKKN
tara:strand:+ start:29 stop:253 length:225 start_codon:yes stop_codon:yes gene_type:complete